ncbi:hypothetical protein [Halalkalicoccus jeotgali]|uniref:Uncharacterized protein n=1 Tax=Halalkalicoccus jeotgali (strain DSM 18796 / CECT 7217 / JCM 14584 / KCTC 4019 / B3) TaxID=795797 RepID=D8J8L3_HALJB|nr:hypothetical protein [Halalkalicoccus jeotgali]ADJ16259.1 hypothetical protein HacjB3_14390 [Halalkalicoccus jeotgali B3]ELY36994.1 hypothetical protein C497_09623 [Halalkalicoccus jeotgali B3]
MFPIDGTEHERGAIERTRRRLYVGAGLCAGSALGTAGAALLDVPVAVALFGGAVPLLGLQAYREHRLLDRLQRRSARAEDAYVRETLS